eukprot:s3030_g8.t1
MFADCLHYQVDLIGGDANMALYRAMGSKQESVDIRGGMYQSLLDYLLEAYSESPSCTHLCKAEGSKGGESSKGKESQKGKSKGKNKGKK